MRAAEANQRKADAEIKGLGKARPQAHGSSGGGDHVTTAAKWVRRRLVRLWRRLLTGEQQHRAATPLAMSDAEAAGGHRAAALDGQTQPSPQQILLSHQAPSAGRGSGTLWTRLNRKPSPHMQYGFRVRTIKLEAGQLIAHVDRKKVQSNAYGFRLKLKETRLGGGGGGCGGGGGGGYDVRYVSISSVNQSPPKKGNNLQ